MFWEIEKLEIGKKKEITFKEVLLVSDEKKIKIGTPLVKSAKVTAKVLEPEMKGRKVTVIKFKAKKRYKKKMGFRPRYTKLEITKITT